METHYFIAAAIPVEIRDEYYQWMKSLSDMTSFKSFVHPQDYHLTLVFLGDLGNKSLISLIHKLEFVTNRYREIPLQLNGLGTFGLQNAPRILYGDVIFGERLLQLQADLYKVCDNLGFQLDKKPFRPHITLARKWNSKENFQEKNILTSNVVKKHTPFSIQHIVLYRTHLKRTPKYEPVHIFTLQP